MASFQQEIPCMQGDQGKYYIHDGYRYDSHFPQEWARCHDHPAAQSPVGGGGPKNCWNCCQYGSINGVFVHYCSNCARYHGDRHSTEIPNTIQTPEALWDKVPYMMGVSFAQIGDSTLEDRSGEFYIPDDGRDDLELECEVEEEEQEEEEQGYEDEGDAGSVDTQLTTISV